MLIFCARRTGQIVFIQRADRKDLYAVVLHLFCRGNCAVGGRQRGLVQIIRPAVRSGTAVGKQDDDAVGTVGRCKHRLRLHHRVVGIGGAVAVQSGNYVQQCGGCALHGNERAVRRSAAGENVGIEGNMFGIVVCTQCVAALGVPRRELHDSDTVIDVVQRGVVCDRLHKCGRRGAQFLHGAGIKCCRSRIDLRCFTRVGQHGRPRRRFVGGSGIVHRHVFAPQHLAIVVPVGVFVQNVILLCAVDRTCGDDGIMLHACRDVQYQNDVGGRDTSRLQRGQRDTYRAVRLYVGCFCAKQSVGLRGEHGQRRQQKQTAEQQRRHAFG